MKQMLYIKADYNDADYVSTFCQVTEDEVAQLKPIITAIKNSKNHCNWDLGEYPNHEDTPEVQYKGILTEEQINLMNDYVPSHEQGIHSIYEIRLLEVIKDEDLLE